MVEIREVDVSYADIVGKVQSAAWKDAYKDIFLPEYINKDTSENRKQECITVLGNKENKYYLILVQNIPIGIIKISIKLVNLCEIESIYFLNEHRGNEYGTQAIDFMKEVYRNYKIILWVLEKNDNAIRFYKKNGFIWTGKKRIINRGYNYYQVQFAYDN
jgi:ribosomal protein S18 acetylase RimI-like enzyme